MANNLHWRALYIHGALVRVDREPQAALEALRGAKLRRACIYYSPDGVTAIPTGAECRLLTGRLHPVGGVVETGECREWPPVESITI